MSRTDRWQTFSAAPHRMLMFGGVIQLLLPLLLWSAEMAGRYTSAWPPLPFAVGSTDAHLLLMLFTIFPFFFFGFLMTTFPRWMAGPLVPKGSYTTTFLLMAAGVLLLYPALFIGPSSTAIALLLFTAGLARGWLALLQVYRATPQADHFYERLLILFLLIGILSAAAFALYLLTGTAALRTVARHAGLWGFLVPIIITVAHRMIPFFSSCVLQEYAVYQPRWSLLALLAAVLAHGILEAAGVGAWRWLADLPMTLLALLHTVRWGLLRSFRIRLLAVLHVGFAWLAIGGALFTVESVAQLAGSGLTLGFGPLHAVSIGFIASMTLAMATRVTLGHSGRPLEADPVTWTLFWGLSITAVIRIIADLPGLFTLFSLPLLVVAAVAWLLFVGFWGSRFLPLYLRPRADGRPG